ncbi:MAG: diacylglycerol kinase family lipid kinase [Bacteroidetes bacterium]|nr:MAG: diacylglycerol kinase family lipid kinase [Bacteroidota bacterium]
MSKQRLFVVANPFSGMQRRKPLHELLDAQLDPARFEYRLVFTEYPGHATQLAEQAVREGYDVVVAAGGDGSVHEVAKPLIGTSVTLGIIPYGSGNGFAMHLGLGRSPVRAVQVLQEGKVIRIDTCLMDDQPFVNLAGLGFDAQVAVKIKNSRLRGFLGYLRHTLEEAISYEMQDFRIEIDGRVLERRCLAVEVANASMYGYGFVVAPPAKVTDGLLDLIVLKQAPKWQYFAEGWRFLNNTLSKSSWWEYHSGREITITPAQPTAAHMDGEGFPIEQPRPIRFSIRPRSLQVLCPRSFPD